MARVAVHQTARGGAPSGRRREFGVQTGLSRVLEGLRQTLRIRRTFAAGPAVFRELTAEPLERALSPSGPGFKAYRVTFGDGPAMFIRATRQRVFADVDAGAAAAVLAKYRPAAAHVLPGMRVLELEGGTGIGAEWLAGLVGPSGAVVSLETDEQSAAFAVRRYPLRNVAFELGDPNCLAGETSGAFDGVVWIDAGGYLSEPHDRWVFHPTEVWRVLRPGGWLLVGGAGSQAAWSGLIAALKPAPVLQGDPSAAGGHGHLLIMKPYDRAGT